jgi:hypothetical protein
MTTAPRLGDFVEVGAFTLLADARALEALLVAEGLTVHLQGVDAVGALPHMSNALGGVRVFVPAADAERAREIVEAAGGEPESAADAAALEGDEVTEGERDRAAKRAFYAAFLGLAFVPGLLHLLSLWNVAAYLRTPGPASPRARRRVIAAALVDVAVLAGLVTFVVAARAK